jgi:beta-galactosidase GanA
MIMRIYNFGLILSGGVLFCNTLFSFGQGKPIPKLVKDDNKYTLMVDGKPFIIMGGQVINNSAFPDRMERVWPLMKAMNANMIQFPVYWDEIEPQEGQFEFDKLDQMIHSARKAGLRVVPLWFGTWKNGAMDYVPAWVKADPVRFPMY